MATSKPNSPVPKRATNLRPTTSPPAGRTVPPIQKPETTNPRRNPNSPKPIAPSTTKRPTAASSKTVTTSTSHAKTQNPKRNPNPVITPSLSKSHKERVGTTKSPSKAKSTVFPKPKADARLARSVTGIRTSVKTGGTGAPLRGRSPGAGTRTVNKTGVTSKLASKRSPSAGPKTDTETDTKGSMSRVNSAPDLIEEGIDMQREKEAEVPVEEEQEVNISPNLEEIDEKSELIPASLLVEEEEVKEEEEEEEVQEEEEKEVLIEIAGENEDQIETNAEIEVKEEEQETIEEVTPAPVPAIPAPVVPVPAVPVPTQGKKDVATSNDAIEVTRSKLIGERKSKVLALAGAFESVMQEKEK